MFFHIGHNFFSGEILYLYIFFSLEKIDTWIITDPSIFMFYFESTKAKVRRKIKLKVKKFLHFQPVTF